MTVSSLRYSFGICNDLMRWWRMQHTYKSITFPSSKSADSAEMSVKFEAARSLSQGRKRTLF